MYLYIYSIMIILLLFTDQNIAIPKVPKMDTNFRINSHSTPCSANDSTGYTCTGKGIFIVYRS